MELENLTTEYKREYTDDIKKTVIAFANTSGGKIYIGVNDDLSIVGVENPDDTMLKLTNATREGIKPDITLFLNCRTEKIENKQVVVLEVQRGTACPYYLASKGLRSEGIFVRQGASSVPATETAILQMIKETAGDSYEEIRSLEQDLTFAQAQKEFAATLAKEQMRSLSLIGSDGLYTNLALLLSDQCVHTIKAAIFEGTTKEIFKDRFEFGGSLFAQLRECFDFIDRYNRTRAEFSGLRRLDFRDYPPIAIREALLNAIVHRDYSFNSSTLISIFDNRIEFVTIGGLVRGITKEDMLLGISVLRNKNLANIFYRLKLIEAYGTGMLKILESYSDYFGKNPLIEVTDNAFKITLFNINAGVTDKKQVVSFTESEGKILKIFETKTEITRRDVEILLSISQSMAIKHLKSLVEKKALEKIGTGKNVIYLVAKI